MQTLNHDPVSKVPEDNNRKVCARCGKPITIQDKFCANCGHARGARRAWYESPSKLVGVAIAVVILIAMLIGTNSDKTNTAPPKFEPATLLPGATLQLRSDEGTAVPVVPTRDLYKEWMRLAQAKDTVGEQTMMNDGQMLMTPSGTRARLLESHDLWDGSYNVRILDGPLYGQSVWTSSVFVSEDKVEEPKTSPPPRQHQAEGEADNLAVGDRAVVYGVLNQMGTDEEAYEATRTGSIMDSLDNVLELAKEHRLLTCDGGHSADPSERVLRMSVVILELGEAPRARDSDRKWAKIRITGLLRWHARQDERSATFADEDHVGSPQDCWKNAGEPPYMYYEHLNSIGAIGYVSRDRLRRVDAEGHDLQFRNMKSDINQLLDQVYKGNQGSPTAPVNVQGPGVSRPVTGKENPKEGPKYVWIPPGSFQMGCSVGAYTEKYMDAFMNNCLSDEEPAHKVSITKGFWLGQTEVTVGAYKRFTGGTGIDMPSDPDFNQGWRNEEMPIVNVSWNDAQGYCAWAGGRLPTEAEWEYAARAGSPDALYGPLDEVAWYGANSGGGAHPVGEKRANGFELYDMLGNVCEWVNDWYDENYYKNSPSQDPAGPTSGTRRVQRGGSWGYDTRNVRVSFRYSSPPGERHPGAGFRCAREVAGP